VARIAAGKLNSPGAGMESFPFSESIHPVQVKSSGEKLMKTHSFPKVSNTTSERVPTRIGGPQVPAPLDV
jgi:hypothetical protein